MPTFDRWLLRAFSPTALPHTIQTLAAAQDEDHHDELEAKAIEAERIIADCNRRLTATAPPSKPAPTPT